MKKQKLFIPGPVDIADEICSVMGQPTQPHYGDEWLVTIHETGELLQRVFQTRNDLYIMVGSGSAGLDASFGSLLTSGEKVLIPTNGFFGGRLVEIARSYGLDVITESFPVDKPIDPKRIGQLLARHPEIQLVAVVHHDTSTGIMNPIRDIARVAHQAGAAIVVDAVSSMGGISIPVDEWGLDVVVTGPNKCLEAPPGLVLVSVSKRAWKMVDARPLRGHGWYLNFATWRDYAKNWGDWHPQPVTMASQNLLALQASLRAIMEEGLVEHYARYQRAADRVRRELKVLGFELYLNESDAAPMISALRIPTGVDALALANFLLDEHGIKISPGLGEMKGKMVRIGHMGLATTDSYIDALVDGVKDFLR